MFRTVPLSIIRSFSLYTQQWYMSYSLQVGSGRSVLILLASCQQICVTYDIYQCVHTAMVYVIQLASRIRTESPDPARKLSANLYDINHCCVYSEKFLKMDR